MYKYCITYILILCLNFLFLRKVDAQCTTIPVMQSIVNGDFELGNLPLNKLGFTSGSYVQKTNICSDVSCYSPIANWQIAKNGWEFCYKCAGMTPNVIPHSGSYAMFIDGAGNATTIWQETVNIMPFQTYYFSVWVALLDQVSPPILQFYVNGNPLGTATDLSVNEPANGVWKQISATWYSGTMTSATISFNELTSNPNTSLGDDFAVDDISFINGCQNVTTKKPDLGPDINICTTNGTITLDSKLVKASGNFYWYEGTSNPQALAITSTGTVVNPDPQNNSITINKPGTYRVCFDDGINCAASSTIVISNTVKPALSDVILCSPAIANLDAGITGPTLNYQWAVPSGVINPGNSPTISTSITGTYTLTVTGISGTGWNCVGSASAKVTSILPTYDHSKIDTFCLGSTQILNGLGTGANAAKYEWYDALTGGNLVGTGASPSIMMPNSGSSYTIYFEDATSKPIAGSPLIDSPSQSGAGNYSHTLVVSKNILLISVQVKPEAVNPCLGASSNYKIVLIQGGTVIQSKSITLNCGVVNTVPLNFYLISGTYTLQLQTTSGNPNVGWFGIFSNSATWPQTIPGYISITGSGGNWGGSFGQYVLIEKSNCDRVPVTIPLKACCFNPKPIVPPGFSICKNDPLKISIKSTANQPTFYWTGPNGFKLTTMDSTITVTSNATASDQGTYSVYLTSSNCVSPSSKSTIDIIVNSSPVPTISSNPKAICKGQATATLSISNCTSCTYNWSDGLGTASSCTVSPAATTNYTVTYTGSNTCSDVGNVTLTVNIPTQITPVTNKSAICLGQDTATLSVTGCSGCTFNWSNSGGTNASFKVSPNVNTIYTLSITDANLCTATGSVSVSVNPLPVADAGDYQFICRTDSTSSLNVNTLGWTYNWTTGDANSIVRPVNSSNPYFLIKDTTMVQVPYHKVLYSVKVTDNNGCTSTDTTSVFFEKDCRPYPHLTLTPDSICFGASSTLLAKVSSSRPAYTVQWSDSKFGTGLGPFSVSPTSTSTYSITVTDDLGRTGSHSIVLIVNTLPTSSVTSDTICVGQTAKLFASCDAAHSCSYVWTKTLDGSTYSGNTLNYISPASPNIASTISYVVTATDVNHCTDIESATIIVNALPTVSLGPILPNPVCFKDAPLTLTSGKPVGGYYSGYAVINGNTFSPSVSGVGTFSVKYHFTDSNQCTDSSSVQNIQVLGSPDFDLTGTNKLCTGEKTTIGSNLKNPSGNDTYLWSDGSTGNALTVTPPLDTTIYVLTITNKAGCTESKAFKVAVSSYPNVNFKADSLEGCVPFKVNFTNQSNPHGISSYLWNFGDVLSGQNLSVLENPSHVFSVPGTYDISLSVTNQPHCTSTKTISKMITADPIPNAGFIYSPPEPSTFNPEVIFTDTSMGNVNPIYNKWYFSDSLSDNNEVTGKSVVTHSFSTNGNFPVKLKVKNAKCFDSTVVMIHVKADHTFYVPNAFTANDDGLNDGFYCKGVGIDENKFEMYIFSRWGEMIYQTKDMYKPWDGKALKSKEYCPDGVYAWVIIYSDFEGKKYKKEGFVTMIK